MMLKRAFDCGIRRVEFRVDSRNARSQAAMKKLGAVREGVLRADRITWTGHVRDTVLFAILQGRVAGMKLIAALALDCRRTARRPLRLDGRAPARPGCSRSRTASRPRRAR